VSPSVAEAIAGVIIATLAAGGGGVWYGAQRAKSEIRKVGADADMSTALAAGEVIDAALKLLEPYKVQLTTQAASITRLHDRVDQLWAHVGALEQIITTAGLIPPKRPDLRSHSSPIGGNPT
jgi:hypothetical protein